MKRQISLILLIGGGLIWSAVTSQRFVGGQALSASSLTYDADRSQLHKSADESAQSKLAPESDSLSYAASEGDGPHNLTLRRHGAALELYDDDTKTVLAQRLMAETRSVSIQGSDCDNDTLTIDFNGGKIAIPDGIYFDGGRGAFDTLVIAGGASASERVDMKNANDGVISLDDLRIVFSNIEPIADTNATFDFTFNATAASETINIINGPEIRGVQTNQINSGASNTFELLNFANKTIVRVNGLGGNDDVNLNVTAPAAGLSAMIVRAGGDPGDKANITSFKLASGSITLQDFGTIAGPTTADGNADLVANTIYLFTNGGAIGTSATVPLEIDAVRLSAISEGGNIFLTDTAGGVAIENVDAGSGNVNLTSLGNSPSGSLIGFSPNDNVADVVGNVVTLKATGPSNANIGQIGYFTTSAQFFEVDANVLNASTNNSRLWISEVGKGATAGAKIGLVDVGVNTAFLQTRNGGSLTSQTADGNPDIKALAVNLRANDAGNLGLSPEAPLETSALSLDAAVLTGAGSINVLQTAGNLGVLSAQTVNGNIDLRTASGNMNLVTVSAGNGSVNLTAGSTAASPDRLLSTTLAVSGTQITLTADSMALGGTINAGSGAGHVVTLRSATTNRPINLDSAAGDPAGELRLGQSELSTITAGTLRIGRSDNKGDFKLKSVLSAPAGWSTLHLITGAKITEIGSGALNIGLLAAEAAGLVDLSLNPSNVSIVAGTTADDFLFKNASTLTVATVDGLVGLNGAIPPRYLELVISSAGKLLTINQPIASASDVFLMADNLALNAGVTAPDYVMSGPFTSTRMIDLGTKSSGNYGITDNELDRVTCANLQLGGSPSIAANITVTAPITQAGSGYKTLTLWTSRSVINGGGSIAGTNLYLSSATGIGSATKPLAISVANLNFYNKAGAVVSTDPVNILNTGDLNLPNVPNLGDNGNEESETIIAATGSITLGASINSADNLTLNSGTGLFVGAGGHLTCLAKGALFFTDSSSTGHHWVVGQSGVAGNLGVNIPYSGFSSLQISGSTGSDTFDVSPSSTTSINILGNSPTSAPGDVLNVNPDHTAVPRVNILSSSGASKNGNYTSSNRQPINFVSIETIVGPVNTIGLPVKATEGAPLTNMKIATFNSFDPAVLLANFTATIDWGDSTAPATGTVTGADGAYQITGSHTYAEEGAYNILMTIHDSSTGLDRIVISTATVADAPLSIVSLNPGSNTQFSGVGGNNTTITAGSANAAMLAFQSAVGGADNGPNPPPKANGFRTINWDNVVFDGTDFGGATTTIVKNKIVAIPVNRFQERGIKFEKTYAVSGDGFLSVNPTAGGPFGAFSPAKTFAPYNDNTIDFSFVLPGSHTVPAVQAVTRGFGAIFIDVETANTTSIEYFNGNTSLGKFFVPVGTRGQAEFFGVLFQNPAVTRIHIDLGNATLFNFDGTSVTPGSINNAAGGTDLAAMDDFVYPEPASVPTGIAINAIAAVPITARVASFTDANPNGKLSEYSSSIDWGDGAASAGTITKNASGGFDVVGTHTYLAVGTFTITISIRDAGGASISGTSIAMVGPPPPLPTPTATPTPSPTATPTPTPTATPTPTPTLMSVVQFSAANYNVQEDCTALTITVNRMGDPAAAATVDYHTSDGSATELNDYITAVGTLRFAAGETSKSFDVLINEDSFVEGTE